MNRSMAGAAVATLALLGSLPASAADGAYVGAGYGITRYEVRCDGGACDRRDSGFRVAAGWGFGGHWSVEAVYLDLGTFTASDRTAGGTPFRGTADLKGVGATLGYSLPLGAAFDVAVRVGGASMKSDFSPGPAPAIAGGKTTTQFLGGLTARWRLSPAWSLRADWDHARGRMNRFAGDANAFSVGVQVGFGEVRK